MFGSPSMAPQQQVDYYIEESRTTRIAFENATGNGWREQHLGTIGLRMSALVRATRKLIDTDSAAQQSSRDSDLDRCSGLEVRAADYLNSASRLAAAADRNWPADIQHELEAQAIDLIKASDLMLGEVSKIVARHTGR